MNDLKNGTVITINGEPYAVNYTQHVQMGRGEPVLRTKLKNLLTGKVLERTYKSGDQMEEADIVYKEAQFLYREGEIFHFMDNETYEQFSFQKEKLGDITRFVKPESDVDVLYYDDKPMSVRLPIKIDLKVTSAPPGIKGDTAQGSVMKRVTVETGLEVDVPLFIKEGDTIRINTELGEYVERVKV